VHTNAGSLCGQSTPEEIARGYAKSGYSGIVITDHFIHGHTAVPKNLPWEERMQGYYNAYLAAKAEGDKLGLTVLFGLEHAFGNGQEVLVYNPDLEVLKAHPEIETMPIEEFCALMHAHGAYLSLAHPFREADYIAAPGVHIDPDWVDAMEVFNGCNGDYANFRALYYAAAHGKRYTSGGDIHSAADKRLGLGGMAFLHPIANNEELVAALRSGEGTILCGGKPCVK
ncbi:MAG: PHP domain-containing protein, partial [Clostridia bacterium]|nr:PHP domain-containing protein [Clostridia bacterium]